MAEKSIYLNTDRLFQVKDYALLREDIHVSRPGLGQVLYAPAGAKVRVMSYDPSSPTPYGIRTVSEGYRNAPVTEAQLYPLPPGYTDAVAVGL